MLPMCPACDSVLPLFTYYSKTVQYEKSESRGTRRFDFCRLILHFRVHGHICSGLYSDASRSYIHETVLKWKGIATYINIWRVIVSDLRSIGDDKVGGVNIVNEGSSQVDCTSTRVCHLLLGPGFIHMYVYTLVLRGKIKGREKGTSLRKGVNGPITAQLSLVL